MNSTFVNRAMKVYECLWGGWVTYICTYIERTIVKRRMNARDIRNDISAKCRNINDIKIFRRILALIPI
jgi:hypothetical protein